MTEPDLNHGWILPPVFLTTKLFTLYLRQDKNSLNSPHSIYDWAMFPIYYFLSTKGLSHRNPVIKLGYSASAKLHLEINKSSLYQIEYIRVFILPHFFFLLNLSVIQAMTWISSSESKHFLFPGSWKSRTNISQSPRNLKL